MKLKNKRRMKKFDSSHDVFSSIGAMNRLAEKAASISQQPGSPGLRNASYAFRK